MTCFVFCPLQDFAVPLLPEYMPGDIIHMCSATFAVLVWVSSAR